MTHYSSLAHLAFITLWFSAPVNAHGQKQATSATDMALSPALRAPAQIVDDFHAALAAGDAAGAASRLADDALVFESGGIERGKAEYAAHHLGADAEFSQAVARMMLNRSGQLAGDVAWLASESRISGTHKGKLINSLSIETMVLRRTSGVWKIAHIHWSSRVLKP